MTTVEAVFGAATGATDVGRRRHNEDAYLVKPELGLMLVADGVGGHEAGEVASGITCDTIANRLAEGASLEEAVRSANREVMAAVSGGNGKQGMASTVVAMKLDGADYELAWVGDSRAYLWDGKLKLLTRDHSMMEILLARGEISREEMAGHPQRNVIVQAIGLQAEDSLRVDINRGHLAEGQILLLCSDGMSDVLENAAIAEILASDDSLEDRCQRLVTTSIEHGGKDNATVVLVAGSAPPADAPEPDSIWTFDPATGEISGLVEYAIPPAPPPTLKIVGPRAEPSGESPQTTQMMSIAEVEKALAEKQAAMAEAAAEVDSPGPRRSRWLVGVVLAVAAAAAAWALYTGSAG